MSEKMFASLSSGLLARKGAAKPAMRPQGFGQMGTSLEDLGWNDMGQAAQPAPAPSPTHGPDAESLQRRTVAVGLTPTQPFGQASRDRSPPTAPAVPRPEMAEPVATEAAPVATPAPVVQLPVRPSKAKARAEKGTSGKAAFTLRLDPARHLRLRLACAVSGRSAQGLVTDALDQYLRTIPDLEGLAGQLPGEPQIRSTKG